MNIDELIQTMINEGYYKLEESRFRKCKDINWIKDVIKECDSVSLHDENVKSLLHIMYFGGEYKEIAKDRLRKWMEYHSEE